MLLNYLKIAFRDLFKHKLYSIINIFGLAVGIACCLLIGLYVQNEWSFDTFHSQSDRLYRAWVEETVDDGRVILNTATPVPLGPTIREHIPEAEQVTYIYRFSNLVNTEDRPDGLNEGVLVVNDGFFHMFDFRLISGNEENVFNSPTSVVMGESTARRFFGDENPMQQTISIRLGSEFRDFTVSGIIEDAPSNSSLDYSILIPYENLDQLVSERGRNSWFNIYGSTYMQLREGTDPAVLTPKFEAMMRSTLGDEIYSETNYTIGLQPLTDIHLNTDFPQNLAVVSDPVYSYILAVIALLILLIACVNFMTLSISKSASRAKEVGIRKTVGAIREHLMYQFWGEALLMTLLALGLGITLAELLLPFFNDLSGTSLEMQFTMETVAVMIGVAVVVSLVAGIYPALILSGFRPVEVLKGRLNLSADKSFFRQAMVVSQFALSIALIIGTLIVREQLNYVQNKNLGYQKDQIVVLESGFTPGPQSPLADVFENGFQRKNILRNEVAGMPEIEALAVSSFTPVQMGGWFRLGFRDAQDQQHAFHGNIVDADFISALGIKMVQGRNFSEDNPSDPRRAVVVNEALVSYFGWDNPIGQRLPGPEFEDHEIIGVVEDFHYESLHTPVEPLALAMTPSVLFSGINNMSLSNSPAPRYSLKVSTDNLSETMAGIQDIWGKVAPGVPFDYTFVDQALDTRYREEQRLSRIVTTGAVLAVIIACLGLFGLASLMVVRRTKEIGVRKVLGATASSIVLLVNKEFTRLVAIAFLIAAPVAWYIMSQWLQDFAYRIDLGLGLFLLAGLAALVIAWLTVSYQSVKATLVNPVDSLRSE